MKPTTASILLLAGLALPASLARAAGDTVDLQSRGGVGLTLNLPGRWSSELGYENRRFENLSAFRGHYFTVEGGYRLTKHLDLLAHFRLAKGTGWTSHRYGFGFEYERKAGGFSLGFRPILQHRTKATDDDDTGGAGDTFLRARLQARYGLTGRLDAYASVEPYFAFGADYPVDNWKDTLGLRYELTKHARVDLYYIYRPDYGKSYNRTFHVVGFELRFKAKVPAR